MHRTTLLVLAALVVPGAALADKADADACAARISGPAKTIYRGSVGLVMRGSTLENAMRRVVKPRVDRGQYSENEARRYGREAANCVRLVHRRG